MAGLNIPDCYPGNGKVSHPAITPDLLQNITFKKTRFLLITTYYSLALI